MVDLAELLHHQVEELIRLTNAPDPFAPIRASAVLRQLLLDGAASVVQRVQAELWRRNLPQKVLFTVAADPDPRQPIWFYSPHMNAAGRADVRLDQFLRVLVGGSFPVVPTESVAVGDLVRYAAHVEGGVHAGQPDAPQQAIADILAHFPGLGTAEALKAALRVVGRIVVRALQPFREELLGLSRFDGRPGVCSHLLIEIRSTSPEGDLDVVTFGSADLGIRVFVRDNTLRMIVRGPQGTVLTEGAHVPSGRFWLLSDVVVGHGEVLMRTSVDGLDSIAIETNVGEFDPQDVLDGRMRLGYSGFGSFALSTTLVAITPAYVRAPDLIAQVESMVANAGATHHVVFDPGHGLEQGADGHLHATSPESAPRVE